MKKTTVEGIGVAIQGYESDYLDLSDHHKLVAISDMFKDAGAEVVDDFVNGALTCDREEGPGVETLKQYRLETGRRYPRVYRVKLSIELEELPESESDAFWEKRRYVDQPDDAEECR